MIGRIIRGIRKEKGLSLTSLSQKTGLNLGHLSHIENGSRNPSFKALGKITHALEVPVEQLLYNLSPDRVKEGKEEYGYFRHIPRDLILAADKIRGYIQCPRYAENANLAVKITDESMNPLINKNEYVFLKLHSPLSNGDIGLFIKGKQVLCRRFFKLEDHIELHADNKDYKTIYPDENSLYIIGKVILP